VAHLLPRTRLGCATAGIGLLAVVACGLLGFGGWVGTRGGESWLARRIEDLGSWTTTGGALGVGGLSLGPRGLRIDEIALRDPDGNVVMGAGRIVAEFRPWTARTGVLELPHIRLDDVVLDLAADEEGVLNLSRLFGGPTEPDPNKPEKPFRLPIGFHSPQLELNGLTVRYATATGPVMEIAGLHGMAALHGEGDRIALTDLHLSGQIAKPGPLSLQTRGAVTWDASDGIELDELQILVPHGQAVANGTVGTEMGVGVRIERLEARALDPVTGDMGIGGVWAGSISASGQSDSFDVTTALRGIERSTGILALSAHIDNKETLAWKATSDLTEFHLEQLLTSLGQPVVLNGLIEAHGKGTELAQDGLGQGLELDGTWKGGPQNLYGQKVDMLDAAFSIRGTELALDSTIDGIVGRLAVLGTIDIQHGPIDLDVSGSLEGDRLAELGTQGLDGNGQFTAKVSTDWKQDPVVVDVVGEAEYAPFLYPNLSVARLTAPFSTRVVNGEVDGEIALHGTGVDAMGLTGETLDAVGVTFHREATGEVRAGGPVSLANVAYGSLMTAAWVDTEFTFAMAGSHRQVNADVRLAEYTLAGRPGTDGEVTVRMRDDLLVTDLHMKDFGRQVLDGVVSMDLGEQEVQLGPLAFAPTPRTTWTSQGGSMRLVDGGVEDLSLQLQSDLGTLAVSGKLGTEGTLDGVVELDNFQLDHVAELYPDSWSGLAGALDLDLRLRGDASSPVFEGSLDLDGLFMEETVRWLDVEGDFELADGVFSPDLRLGVAGEALGMLTGELPLEGGLDSLAPALDSPVDVQLALMPGGLERLVRAAPSLDEQELPEGRFSGVLQATGVLRDPDLRVAGISEIAVPGWREPGRIELDMSRRASELVIDADVREGLATRAQIHGEGVTRLGEVLAYVMKATPEATAPEYSDPTLYLDDMNISAALLGLPVASLGAMAGSEVELGGELLGGFVVSGSPIEPTVEGGLQWLEPMVGGQALEGAYLAIIPQEDGYQLDTSFDFVGAGGIEVSGKVPMSLAVTQPLDQWSLGEMALDVKGEGIPIPLIAELNPRFEASEAQGLIRIEGQVKGTVADPLPELLATIEGGALADRYLGVQATDLNARVQFDSRRVRVENIDFSLVPIRRFQPTELADELAQAVSEEPHVKVTGTAQLEEWQLSALSGKVSLNGGPWLMSTADTVIRTDGDVMVSGKWPTLAVRGDLALVYGRIGLDAAAMQSRSPLSLDSTLSVVRGEQTPVAPPTEEPAMYAAFDVDVNVDLKRNLELTMGIPFVTDFGDVGAAFSRVDLSGRVGGQLQVELEDSEPTLVGSVELVEGQARMLRSAFDLDGGTITFAGGNPAEDAILDLTAEMTGADADLTMVIQGNALRPEISFSSEQYPDPSDQMTLLITGRPPEELTAEAGAGAAEAMAGLLFSSLFAGQSLGTVAIEPDGSVRVGVPLTSTVYAASSLSPTPNPSENSVTFEMEWTLLPRVVASGGIGNRSSWGDLFWEIRF
jgi:hypothetical protein